MRIAFIVNCFPSLSETFILNQITGLLDLGHEVKIFSQFRPKEEKTHSDVKRYNLLKRTNYFDVPRNKILRIIKAIYLMINNFPKHPIMIIKSLNIFNYDRKAGSLSLTYIFALISFLKYEFDIIHCHFGENGKIGSVLKQIGIKGKLLIEFHGYDIRQGIEKGQDLYSFLFKRGDCFLAISKYNYKNLLQFGAPPQKILIHPVGIDINRFPYRWSSPAKELPESIRIISIGRLVEEKGLIYGIKAVAQLLTKNPALKFKYFIIGGGPLEKDLKTAVIQQQLNNAIYFLGPIEQKEVINQLKQSHIFILPSIAEALPVVLMEAQAIGLPTIATSVGGISEVLIDKISGFIVPPKNPEAIVEKLEYLIKNPEMWSKMGQAGRKHIETNFSIYKLNKRLVRIYQDLLEENH